MTLLHESHKAIEVWRLSTKLEALNEAKTLRGECGALARQVDKLSHSSSTHPTDLFGEITHHMMVLV